MQTDVLVVGAGPTGLMLATELGLAGVVPVVVDALPAPSGQAKGGGVQPRTAEVFDLRGMMDQLLDRGLSREPVSGHFGGLPVALDCRPWGTRHPYVRPVPQGRIEQLLAERLADYGVSVHRGHELTALHPDDDGATAIVHDRPPALISTFAPVTWWPATVDTARSGNCWGSRFPAKLAPWLLSSPRCA